MNRELYVNNYCIVRDHRIYVNGKLCFESPVSNGLREFAKAAYRNLAPNYNKFFKMDEISKLGFIASEYLLNYISIDEYKNDEISIILSNSHSTLVTDTNHQNTISDPESFFPSPSVFVYTLPNIMIGEISIRNGIKGENAFFIVEKFNPEIIVNHINNLFLTNKSRAFIGGWVNHTETDYEAFLYFVTDKKALPHNRQVINNLYNNL